MSEYLRLTHSLLVNLGGTSSPETFPIDDRAVPAPPSAQAVNYAKGDRKFTPSAFTFFQGSLINMSLVGHIHQPDGASLPVLFASVTSGVLVRHDGQMTPYFQPSVREVVLIPEKLSAGEEHIEAYRNAGLDIERYPLANTYSGIRQNASDRAKEILAQLKQDVFLAFADAVGSDDYLILIDGSLNPTKEVLQHNNWIGIFNNPNLSAAEEKMSLQLGENQIGLPFSNSGGSSEYFWHLRMYSDNRKGPAWGIIRLVNSLSKGDDMQSKITAISSGVLAERYPIHPFSEKEGWRLYPLITARVYLRTQITREDTILRFF